MRGGSQLIHGLWTRSENGHAEIAQLDGNLVLQHRQRLFVLRRDQDAFPVGHEVTHQVRNGVGLAGSGRPLHRDASRRDELPDDPILVLVGGQRKQRAICQRLPALGGLRSEFHQRAFDCGIIRHHGRDALGEETGFVDHLRELGIEPLVPEGTSPGRHHPCRSEDRRRCRIRDGVLVIDPSIEAQWSNQLVVDLAQATFQPRIRDRLTQTLAQPGQLLDQRESEALECVELQFAWSLRDEPKAAIVLVDLDRDTGGEHRGNHRLAGDIPGQHAVAPCELVRRLIGLQEQMQAEQIRIESASRSRGLHLGNPGKPLRGDPVIEGLLQSLPRNATVSDVL